MPEGDIVHRPDPEAVEEMNVTAFMREHDIPDYDALIERTTSDIDWFWDEVVDALDIEFYEPYEAVRDDSDGPQFTQWYPGGELNVAHNVLDRHAGEVDRPAYIWEGEDGEIRRTGYDELLERSNQVANALAALDVEAGDRVGVYMPMVPAIVPILYGALKRGAVVVPIFSGFGVDAVATRLEEPECRVLFTADGMYRRGREIPLKETADEAIARTDCVEDVIVYQRTGGDVAWHDARDRRWNETVLEADVEAETRSMAAEDPAMILYSSGTTGRPKGIVQTHGGVQVQTAKEVYYGFDLQPDEDVFWWVSDIGWMMGPWMLIGTHTFGGTVLLYEGAPDHPEPDRFWEMIDRHDVTTFGVSPTAIRALREHGEEYVERHDLSSLRLLGSTGEPWDPESWEWYYAVVGGGRCPIINISGGTEICGCFLMPMPNQPLKPCTLGGPGLGMDIDIVNSAGESIADTGERGFLVARDSCPSMTKSLWEGDERYLEEYWSTWDDLWDHGDWAQRDEEGFWYLHGRADDALNVAGRKVGPAEVEGALIDHAAVAQAAAIGVPDETTGTAVVTYVILEPGAEPDDELREELRAHVGEVMGKPFRPREIEFVDELPLTQSGKILRRVIQAAHLGEETGDMSTIENPEAVEAIREAD